MPPPERLRRRSSGGFGAIGDTCFDARAAREDVVTRITFCPFAAARARERQVSHDVFLRSSFNQATKALEHPREGGSEQLSTGIGCKRRPGRHPLSNPIGCPSASAGIT